MSAATKEILNHDSFFAGVEFYSKHRHPKFIEDPLFRYKKRKDMDEPRKIEQKMPYGGWEKIFYVQEANKDCVFVECVVGGICMEGVINFKDFLIH